MAADRIVSERVAASDGPTGGNAPATGTRAARELGARLAARQRRAAALARRERQIGNARLVVFLAGALVAWLSVGRNVLSPYWLAAPISAFAGLLLYHGRVIADRRRADRAVVFYQDGVARLEDRWAGRGVSGDRFLDRSHAYARDLDLFGDGSLFQLLCTARTPIGERALARWLCGAAAPSEITARQEAVGELRDKLDLREELALTGADVGAALHPDELARWAKSPASLARPRLRVLALLAVVAVALAYGARALGVAGSLPLAVVLAIEAAVGLSLRPRVRAALRAVDLPGRDLALLAQVLLIIERHTFEAPLLRALQSTLETRGVSASRQVARLGRLIALLDARRNQLFAPLAPVLLWATQLCMTIDAWRVAAGAAVPRWIAAVGDFEALCAVAGFAYERDDAIMPEVTADGPLFDAAGLGHPLLPRRRVVRNDVHLSRDRALLVVSGSNMSGKSTLLRTIGCNAVLAQLGAPVCAQRLRLSPLAVATSMRVDDSLREGTSRFYAEITRLRQIVDLARQQPPVLFLLDEILHGTNSHDRRIGAEAIVRTLLAHGAVGLVTTHDLTLSQIADNLAPRARNVHFADHLEDGQMVFDYRMHAGVVTKSNALELMRAMGLIGCDDAVESRDGAPRPTARVPTPAV